MKKSFKRIKQNNKGFSLIELIIVVAIMAVLTAVVGVQLSHYIARAQKASDIYTADKIASAYIMAAAAHPEVYTLMEDFRDGKDSYHGTNNNAYQNLRVTVSATVDGVTETYDVVLLVASENTTWTGGMAVYRETGFYDTLNAELGLTPGAGKNPYMIPKYKAQKSGQYRAPNWTKTYAKSVDRWRIVERIDNGTIEVWSADGTTYGGWPYYRVYPKPDDLYTN